MPSVSAPDAHGDWAVATNEHGKKVLVTWIQLSTGKTEKHELVGSPSGTAVSRGPSGAHVAVNWQKVLHVFTHGGAPKMPAAAAPKAAPLPKGSSALIARIERKTKVNDHVDQAEGSGQDGDFVRYELAQKFWAVKLEGDSFRVRFGKQGTDGREQVKSFTDAAAAQKEHDKLVASKVKKGYRAV